MASQLFVDLYGCDREIIDNLEKIRKIAHEAIDRLGAGIVEECSHRFSPVGITYIAVITTSHFSVHTWPEFGYAAVDVFSCDENVPEAMAESLAEAFRAKKVKVRSFERVIGEGE
ncbi:MAG: adenosylmethionine decarboxylase [Clostridiales bacterium]|nr:adenosylmethionine decarboxylase [Clostridiales bacterium]